LADFDETCIFSTGNPSDIKFHENPSSGSQVVPCGQTDRQTDMKLIVALQKFVNAPKKDCFYGNIPFETQPEM
jgi:hypothetical protein